MKKDVPKVSLNPVDSGVNESIKGFLNTEEFMKALLRGIGQSSLLSLLVAIAVALGESVHLWYTGPLAPTVIAFAGIVVGYVRTKRIAKKYIDEGDENAPR